jgi:hypothetical protein
VNPKEDSFPTNAKVVFVGACGLAGPVFESLWDINDATKGQALIVQDYSQFTGDVLLGNAAFAWQTMAQALAQGNSVQAAVNQGNAAMQQLGQRERWKVIGDGNVTITQP